MIRINNEPEVKVVPALQNNLRRVLIASSNKGKIREIQNFFKELPIKFLSLKDVFGDNIPEDPEETGETFMENARLKAQYYANLSHLPCLADDSGLCVDRLNGFPGVRSHRFAITPEIPDPDDAERNRRLIEIMQENNVNESTAEYRCAMVLYIPVKKNKGSVYEEERVLEGMIKPVPSGTNGFSFDPYFYLKEYDYAKTCADISMEEKNRISHRAKAMKAIKMDLSFYGMFSGLARQD